MTLDEIIRDILQVQEFDSDSWNKNIINTEEYHRRKNVAVTQAKSAIRELLLEKMPEKHEHALDCDNKPCICLIVYRNNAIAEMQKVIEEITK